MRKNRRHKVAERYGFTLVELSIVLVIIGLLIGGILIGQSLTDSAKTTRLARDLAQYEIATIQFHKKFKQVPGDSGYFTPPGNNDKMITSTAGCAPAPNAMYGARESAQFWAHLTQAGMLSPGYQTWSPEMCGGGHADSYSDPSLNGKVQPYTSPKIAISPSPLLNNTAYISPTKNGANVSLFLTVYLNPSEVIPLEQKLGLVSSTGSTSGLANPYGQETCLVMRLATTPISTTKCINSASTPFYLVGELKYFIVP